MYLCLVMLFAFLECNFLYRLKKTYTLFACICEQFREKQSNKFGLKSLKIDLCPENLLELRRGRPSPISWRHNLFLTSERLKKNIPPVWPVSFLNSHWNKLSKSVKTHHFSKNIRDPVTKWEVKVIYEMLLNFGI